MDGCESLGAKSGDSEVGSSSAPFSKAGLGMFKFGPVRMRNDVRPFGCCAALGARARDKLSCLIVLWTAILAIFCLNVVKVCYS